MKICPVCGQQNKDNASTCENQDCLCLFNLEMGNHKTELYTEEKTSFSQGSLISGRYEIVRELGRGGMGIAFLVKDTKLRNREVALKITHPELVSHEEARQRFKDEVILCLELLHPNIVRVNNLDEWNNCLYFTMEYIPGKSLRQVIDERKESTPPFFTLQETIQVINPVLDALSYAHKTTIHRDIKPENIIIQGELPDIKVKVLDFGIAKVLSASRFTRTAQSMGTAYYMSPEQMQGAKHIDQRADLYSVGMILYEMLTGTIAAGRFRLPGEIIKTLPEQIDTIIDKVLSPFPGNRHSDAQKLKTDLSDSLSKADDKTNGLIAEINTHLKKAEFDQAEEKLFNINSPSDLKEKLINIKNEYNECIRKAEEYFSSANFEPAKTCFEKALSVCSDSKQASLRLQDIKSNIKQSNENTRKFESLIQQADADLKLALFEKVFSTLEHAGKLNVDNNRIKDLQKSANSIRLEYEREISLAKDFLRKMDYSKAIAHALNADKICFNSNASKELTKQIKIAQARDLRDKEMLEKKQEVAQENKIKCEQKILSAQDEFKTEEADHLRKKEIQLGSETIIESEENQFSDITVKQLILAPVVFFAAVALIKMLFLWIL